MEPRARREGLETQTFHDELVVYDLSTDRAHVLHPVVAHLWKQCDGTRTVADLVQSVRAFLDPGFDHDAAWAALDALWDAGLILEKPVAPVGERRLSRREMVRDVAAAGALGMASGAVASILVPMPLQAQSGGSSGDSEMSQKEMEEKVKTEEPPDEEKKEEEKKEEEPPEEEKKEEEPPEEEKKEEEPPEEKKEGEPPEEKKEGEPPEEGKEEEKKEEQKEEPKKQEPPPGSGG